MRSPLTTALCLGWTFLMMVGPMSAQWQAVRVPDFPWTFKQTQPDEFLVQTWRVYYTEGRNPDFQADGVGLYRVGLDGTVRELFRRSEAIDASASGTLPSGLDMIGQTCIMGFEDDTHDGPRNLIALFDVDADTVMITDTVEILQLCSGDRAYVVAPDPLTGEYTQFGHLNLISRQMESGPVGYEVEDRSGLWSIVLDTADVRWLMHGCDNMVGTLFDPENTEYDYWVERNGRVVVGGPPWHGPRTRYSADSGRSWHPAPFEMNANSISILDDGLWLCQTDRDTLGRSWISYFDEATRTAIPIAQLPDSVSIISMRGADLRSVVLTASNWQFKNGSRGYALVRADLSTSVSGEAGGPVSASGSWQLVDLQGRVVLQGTGSLPYTSVPKGMYILRQGNQTHKIWTQ